MTFVLVNALFLGVALAVALVARPELVVLDEPTSALDPLGRVDVRDVVLSLRSRGVAVLLNSHLIGEVERVCDQVVILDGGRVAASGTLAELLGGRGHAGEVQAHLVLAQQLDQRPRRRHAAAVEDDHPVAHPLHLARRLRRLRFRATGSG